MIHFVGCRCRLSPFLFEGRGQGEGSTGIVGSSKTPHLHPLPSNRGEAGMPRVTFAPN
jgi:hypothetical protein